MEQIIAFLIGQKLIQILSDSFFDVITSKYPNAMIKLNEMKFLNRLNLNNKGSMFLTFMAIALGIMGWNILYIAAYLLIIKILYRNEP